MSVTSSGYCDLRHCACDLIVWAESNEASSVLCADDVLANISHHLSLSSRDRCAIERPFDRTVFGCVT